MMEIWKDIPGYEGFYQASSKGQIKSLSRVVRHNLGGDKIINERILNGYVNKYGYKRVELSKRGHSKQYSEHRLVALAFLGESDLTVNHIDGNKLNNNIENLEYLSIADNTRHAVTIGLIKNNSNIHKEEIIKDYQNGYRLRDLEDKYKTSHHDIRRILKECSIPIESKGMRRRRYKVDEEELRKYISLGLNDSEIARRMNVTRSVIRYRRSLIKNTI